MADSDHIADPPQSARRPAWVFVVIAYGIAMAASPEFISFGTPMQVTITGVGIAGIGLAILLTGVE